MQHAALETHQLTKYFKEKAALSSLSLTIPKGGTHAIVGRNGAGKSTLFRLLLGFLTPNAGSCKILGQNSCAIASEIRAQVGFVNEEHTLPNWMTAQQVKAFQQHFYPKWQEKTFQQVLSNFDLDPAQKVKSLSRGERAGLNLAMALAQYPRLLILDEPTLGLDVVAKKAFLESLIFTGFEQETTVIYCSHDMAEIERVTDNLVVMVSGQISYSGSPDKFCERFSFWQATVPSGATLDDLPGVLTLREFEGEWHLVVLDQGPEFGEILRTRGAENFHREAVSLETAVNAFLTSRKLLPGHHQRRAS